MITYPKIQTMFMRDPATKKKYLLEGRYAEPEFDVLEHARWEVTEKIDGTNVRVFWDGAEVSFYCRKENSALPGQLLNNLKDLFIPGQLSEVFDFDHKGIILFGEGCGKGIQKAGPLYGEKQTLILFDVYICETNIWLERADVNDIAHRLGISSGPVIGAMSLIDVLALVKNGFKSAYGDDMAEGVVCRAPLGMLSRRGYRIITKLKHKDFPR